MDKKTVIKRVKKYADTVKKFFPVKKIVLYGSYANGTHREDSDIDVAVILESVDDDFLKSETKLF